MSCPLCGLHVELWGYHLACHVSPDGRPCWVGGLSKDEAAWIASDLRTDPRLMERAHP